MIGGLYDSIIGKKKNEYGMDGGLGDYGTYTGQDGTKIEINEDAFKAIQSGGLQGGRLSKNESGGIFDTIGGWFQPHGQSGASTAGNVLSGIGTAVGIGSGLAGMYYSKKQADINKERAKMEKDAYNRGVQREAQAEARMQQFAKNAGNGAFYA